MRIPIPRQTFGYWNVFEGRGVNERPTISNILLKKKLVFWGLHYHCNRPYPHQSSFPRTIKIKLFFSNSFHFILPLNVFFLFLCIFSLHLLSFFSSIEALLIKNLPFFLSKEQPAGSYIVFNSQMAQPLNIFLKITY